MAKNHKVDAKALLAIVSRSGPDSPLTRGEAAALVTELAGTPAREVYEQRKRFATKIDRAPSSDQPSSRSRTPRLPRKPDCPLRVGDVVRWAEAVLGRTFVDLPHDPPRTVDLAGTGSVSVFAGNAEARVLPGSLAKCHELILSLDAEIDRLGRENERLARGWTAEVHLNFNKGK